MEIIGRMINGVGSAALLLSMTKTIQDEQDVKEYLKKDGYRFAVTEVGGNTAQGSFQDKVIRSVVGAVLNNKVAEKESYEIHAILHAAMEAKAGVVSTGTGAADVSVKIAIVRKDSWVAVAMFGESAIYHMTNHERSGLGIMHV